LPYITSLEHVSNNNSERDGFYARAANETDVVLFLRQYFHNLSNYLIANPNKGEQKMSYPGSSRITIELPVPYCYKGQWENYDIERSSSVKETASVAKAILPEGGAVLEDSAVDFNERTFTFLNSDGLQKAAIWMKTAAYDRFANVDFLKKNAIKMKALFDSKTPVVPYLLYMVYNTT
jgi:hypothetical protein